MSKTIQKKVILFIVEGVSDKVALGLPMSKLVSSNDVQFAIMHGDCLNRRPENVITAVRNSVRSIMQKYSYRRSDFKQIVHIVDTDGAFIPDKYVISRIERGIEYFNDHIETGEYYETIQRHHRRQESAKILSTTNEIAKIPYGIYFMSRNLEHVTQGICTSVTSKRKVEFAEEFARKYGYDAYNFMDLLFSDEVAAKNNYEDSWIDIMKGNNSLKRKCNLNFFLKDYYFDEYGDKSSMNK